MNEIEFEILDQLYFLTEFETLIKELDFDEEIDQTF